MKRLVLVILIGVLSIFSSNNIWAQSKNYSNLAYTDNAAKTKVLRPSVPKRANQLKKELNLDEKQTAEVKILLENHFEKAASIKAQNKDKETFSENIQLKAARMQFHKELKKILDKDQRQKLKAFRDKRKAEKKTEAKKK